MRKDIKKIIIELLVNNKIAPDLGMLSKDFLSVIEESTVVSMQEEIVDTDSIFQIYTRREENLRKQGIKCFGLNETLSAIKSGDRLFKIVSFANEEYLSTVFISPESDFISGIFRMPISKETFDRIKDNEN